MEKVINQIIHPVEGTVVFNMADLLMISLNNYTAAQKLVELYVESLTDSMMTINEALTTRNWESVGLLAHGIKGSSANLRIYRVSHYAGLIENCSLNGDHTLLPELINYLEKEIDSFLIIYRNIDWTKRPPK